MNVVIINILLLISAVLIAGHTVEDCALYLQYNGGGAYTAVVTDQTGVVYTTPISYQCGEKIGFTQPYQVCVECPTTGQTNIYTASLEDTTTSTTLFSGFPITCTAGTLRTVCATPTFTNPLHPFRSYELTFLFGKANYKNAGTSGDPHFKGFRGQSFDFSGEKGKIFEVFSDKYSSVNAYFSDPTHDNRKIVTYMTSFGVKYADLTVQIDANRTEGQIIANNVVINLPLNSEVKLSECVYALYRKGRHSAVQIQSNHQVYDFQLISGEYINFGLSIKGDDLKNLGGILGLTEKEDFNITNYKNTDFMENDLFSSTIQYTKYSGAELLCSVNDVVSTLAPSQITPTTTVTKPVVHTAHVNHDKVVETFSTN